MKTLTAAPAAALVAAVLCVGAVHAQPASAAATTTIRVGFTDLNLSRPEGRAVLERRVDRAVEKVCAPRPMPRELPQQHSFVVCRKAAWAGAHDQLVALYHRPDFAEAAVLVTAQLN